MILLPNRRRGSRTDPDSAVSRREFDALEPPAAEVLCTPSSEHSARAMLEAAKRKTPHAGPLWGLHCDFAHHTETIGRRFTGQARRHHTILTTARAHSAVF